LGSIQHFKGKFGDGLLMDVKLDQPTDSDIEQLLQRAGIINLSDRLSVERMQQTCALLEDTDRFAWISSNHETGFPQ
jgi:hypothetical protein